MTTSGLSRAAVAQARLGAAPAFIDDRVARYGSGIFTTHVFRERTVFSADPAFNRLLLTAESVRSEYVKFIDGFFSIPFPFAHLLPFTTYGQALKARKKVAGALREVIGKRMDDKLEDGVADSEDKREKKDMVEELLEAEDGSFSVEEMVNLFGN